MHNLLVIIAK